MRRIIRVGISIELVTSVFSTGWNSKPYFIECIAGLPEGARLMGMNYDTAFNMIYLYFEHDSFAQTGFVIPDLKPEFAKYFPDVAENCECRYELRDQSSKAILEKGE
jgi:hypothetical protein